jgi:hypothetical protein
MNNTLYLLENIFQPSVVLVNGTKIPLDEFIVEDEPAYAPKLQDFKNYIELLGDYEFPYLMFNNTFECPQMSNLVYSERIVNTLNEKGLHIFITENLMKYNGKRIFHSNLDRNPFLLVNNDDGLQKGIFNNPRAGQLDSIQDLINNNKLTNVTIFVPEHNVKSAISRYSHMDIQWKDLFLEYFITTDNIILKDKHAINYTFINTNWRYEPYRHVVASYLKNYNSKISWVYESSVEVFKNNIWFEPNDKLLNGFQILNQSTPLNLDMLVNDSVMLEGNILDRFKLPAYDIMPTIPSSDMYNDVFCSIVNESSFLDITTYISDKTLTAIMNCIPFVIVGPPHALKTVQQMGFKTFHKYWDESYDNEFDHTKRIYKIFKVIDTIASFSKDELVKMQEDMQDILIYNKKHIKKCIDYNEF